jgi:hypothetical protein
MENVKMTDTNKYEAIKEILVANDADTTLVDFCDTKIAQIAAKAEKAKERAAEKKAIGDELRAVIADLLTEEPQSAEAILDQLEGEDLTVAKIRARLSQLVKVNQASKVEKNIDGKKKVLYTIFTGDAE